MKCIFDSETGCLVDIYPTRDPSANEVLVDYTGALPGPSETLLYDADNGTVIIVPGSECGGEESTIVLHDHLYMYTYLSKDINLAAKRTTMIPFDKLDMKVDDPDNGVTFTFNENNGVVTVPAGVYFINMTALLYSNWNKVLKCVSILNNGEQIAQQYISSYKFKLNSLSITTIVPLTHEKNNLFVYVDDTSHDMKEFIRWYGRGVRMMGGRSHTYFYLIKM